MQSFAFPLRRRTLAFVGTELAVVGHLLALVGDSLPLIGDAIPFVSNPLAPQQLAFAASESPPSAIQLRNAPIRFAPSVSAIITDHDLP